MISNENNREELKTPEFKRYKRDPNRMPVGGNSADTGAMSESMSVNGALSTKNEVPRDEACEKTAVSDNAVTEDSTAVFAKVNVKKEDGSLEGLKATDGYVSDVLEETKPEPKRDKDRINIDFDGREPLKKPEPQAVAKASVPKSDGVRVPNAQNVPTRTVNPSADSEQNVYSRTRPGVSKPKVPKTEVKKPDGEKNDNGSDTVCVDKVKVSENAPKLVRTPAVIPQKQNDSPHLLATENDDLEIDENPSEESNSKSGALGALVGVVKAVVYIAAVLAVSILLALGMINAANDIFAFVKDDEPVTVVVPADCSLKELSEILGDAGAIKYPWLFEFYTDFKDNDMVYDSNSEKYVKCTFVSGTYQISPTLNYDYMIREFIEKPTERTTVVITIPEGYTTDQIVNLLVENGLGTREGYIRAINEYDGYDFKFLDILEVSDERYWRLDGYLYPDTYYYFSNATEETIVYKMLDNFNSKLTSEYYERADELGMEFDDLITLASMIQKEVSKPQEMGLVSSVFHNRLADSATYPLLQSDATIVYAIEHETGERPKAVDTTYVSPYNSYQNAGLPPGPICNPSLEAIRYAMYPTDSKYYYFYSPPNGDETKFSLNYNAHIAVINSYR